MISSFNYPLVVYRWLLKALSVPADSLRRRLCLQSRECSRDTTYKEYDLLVLPKRIATKDSSRRNPERYFSLSVEVKDWQRAGTNHRWWRETLAMKLAYRGVRGTSSWSSWSLRSSSSSHPHKVRDSGHLYNAERHLR